MDWITDRIAIGNYLEAQDAALLKQHAFRAVLSLNATLTFDRAAEFGLDEIASHRLIDGAGNERRAFFAAIDDLTRLAEAAPPVLVHCHAGRSRSVAVVAGYLMRRDRLEPEEAIALVAAKRESAVSPELIELLHWLET